MVKPDTRHITRVVGISYKADGRVCIRVEYGLVSVYADQAPNYSYREFWV